MSSQPIFREYVSVTCPLKVNIKSEIWVICGIVLRGRSNQIEGSPRPVFHVRSGSAEASVLSVAARFPHVTVVQGACPLELNFGNVMYCFPEKLFPREKSLERSADWKGTSVSVSVPACALSQLQVVILSSPVIAHPLWAPPSSQMLQV